MASKHYATNGATALYFFIVETNPNYCNQPEHKRLCVVNPTEKPLTMIALEVERRDPLCEIAQENY